MRLTNLIMDILSLRHLLAPIKELAVASDHEEMFPHSEFELIRNAGLLHAQLEKSTLQFDNRQSNNILAILSTIGSLSLPVGRIYEGHINALQLIELFGTDLQKQKYFKGVFENQSLFGVWNTQDENGLRIKDIGNGQFRLDGSKTFCSGAGWIQNPVITGEFDSDNYKGWQMFILPNDQLSKVQVDSSFWKPLGMRASASYRINFSGIIIEKEDMLGPVDAYYQEPYFSGGAIRFAAVQLGGAQAILEETHQFLRSLQRTNDPFQRARVAEITYLVETGELWINRAGLKTDQCMSSENGIKELVIYAHMTRTVINEICLRCLRLAEHCVGARGLMRPHALERIHRDLITYTKQPAPDAILTSVGEYVLGKSSIAQLWKEFENHPVKAPLL